ncbi:hypothetical protein PHYPSEUDO_006022 [Phytophthora pseudosyringae]|uniref:Uncharacterized protein n=1 Tax=Phytophthora pseudosyringae TaxID=221518 RepID=A0A8T1VPW4_9STRA|nr:hypothetical protein PHYPSEUDO_006022 [Phytophthora pseudosyringae]
MQCGAHFSRRESYSTRISSADLPVTHTRGPNITPNSIAYRAVKTMNNTETPSTKATVVSTASETDQVTSTDAVCQNTMKKAGQILMKSMTNANPVVALAVVASW